MFPHALLSLSLQFDMMRGRHGMRHVLHILLNVCNLTPYIQTARIVLKTEGQVDCLSIPKEGFTPGNDIVSLSLIGVSHENASMEQDSLSMFGLQMQHGFLIDFLSSILD
jgi:hypothetical protein